VAVRPASLFTGSHPHYHTAPTQHHKWEWAEDDHDSRTM